MKNLIILALTLWLGTAQAETVNQTALDLENNYLEIAKTLSTSYDQNGPCGGFVEAYTMDIVDATEKARNYFDTNYLWNKATGRKFKIDPVVTKTLASTLKLKEIMNMLDHKDTKTYERALNRVVMWGPALGVYGNSTYLEFGANNTVTVAAMKFIDEAPWVEWEKSEATYEVIKDNKGMRLDIINNGSVESYYIKSSYKYDWMWSLVPADQSGANPYMNGFVDYPSECEA